MAEYTFHPMYRGLVLRKNSEDLKDWVDRASVKYSQLPNRGIRRGNPPEFVFENGAIIRTGHLNDSNAYTKYQGHEYQKILIEELTHIPEEKNYLRILSSARSVIPELKPQIFCTTNPGSVGHMWVKSRFVDPAPPETTIWDGYRSRIYIPATIDDNPTLIEKDPDYVRTIEDLKEVDGETYRAWRFGDWDVFSGQVFREFRRNSHVIKPIIPRKSFTHILCMDWGYSSESAFAAYLFAVGKMNTDQGDSFNQVVIYKEWYGNEKTPDQWAEEIYKDCSMSDIEINLGYTDPAMHNTNTDGSTSIANMIEKKWTSLNDGRKWLDLEKGSNNRIQGVATLHNWLSYSPIGVPYMVITENCVNLIRTLPQLVYDQHKVDDVDTSQEDHAYDALRYGLSAIRFIGNFSQLSYGKSPHRLRKFNREGDPIAPDLDMWKQSEKKVVKYFA